MIGMVWVSIATYLVLWRSFRLVVDMRDREQASEHARPQQFTLLVRDIPKKERDSKESRKEQVEHFFNRTHPGAFERVELVHKLKPVKPHTLLTPLDLSLLITQCVCFTIV